MLTSGYKPSRRNILAGIGATVGVIALRGHEVLADAAAHFTHGIASGDPLKDRVILWTRVVPGQGTHETISGTWEVALDQTFTKLISTGRFKTDASRDYTVKVDAADLEPGNQYYYRFKTGTITSPIGKTRTLPTNGIQNLKFSVVSCSNYPQGYFNVYGEIAKRDCDAVIHLGDYIYEYADGIYSNPDIVARADK